MRTAGAIACRDHLETCANSKFNLLDVFQRERCGEGLAWEAMNPKYREKLDDIMIFWGPRFALYESGFGWRQHWARTSARIRQHADEEHKEQDPQTRRQVNLITLVEFLSVSMRVRACVYIRVCLCEVVNACVDPCI